MSEDLIKRSDAIEAVEERSFAVRDSYTVKAILRNVPSADRPQEWIPCSERLPKIGEKVLVSTKKTCFVQVFKGIYSDPTRWLWEHNSIKKIDAWMPLPKPWKGANDV